MLTAISVEAAPRRHSPPAVFPAVRRRVSLRCSRMQSVLTVHSLRRSHFGRDFLTGVKQTHSTLEYGIGANSDLTRPIGQGPVGSKRKSKPIRGLSHR